MSEQDITKAVEKEAIEESQTAVKPHDETASEESFQAAFEKTIVSIRPGQVVVGKVVQLTEDEVCLNIGYKSDGIIPKNELLDPEGIKDQFQIGDELEVEVIKVNDGEGNVLLSQRNLQIKKNWDKLVAAYEAGQYIEGVGKEVVKGGLIVNVEGVRTFVPASQLSERYVEKLDQFIGQPIRLKIIEVDRHKKRLVASRKAVIVEEAAAKTAKAWENIEEGKVVKGIVRRLTDFGAFVDLAGWTV
jgi:4-hydroxy-3-methylbut-2-enyl diphosphate reductase